MSLAFPFSQGDLLMGGIWTSETSKPITAFPLFFPSSADVRVLCAPPTLLLLSYTFKELNRVANLKCTNWGTIVTKTLPSSQATKLTKASKTSDTQSREASKVNVAWTLTADTSLTLCLHSAPAWYYYGGLFSSLWMVLEIESSRDDHQLRKQPSKIGRDIQPKRWVNHNLATQEIWKGKEIWLLKNLTTPQ
jgi:hypothetical protein